MPTVINSLPNMDMDGLEDTIKINENIGVSKDFLFSQYKNIMDEQVPLLEDKFQQILDLSTEEWKKIWTKWRDEGVI